MPKLAAYPPEYFPVYVPSHVSPERNMLVGDHWIIVKLKDSTWLPEKVKDEIETDRIIKTQDIETLRKRIEPAIGGLTIPRRSDARR